MKNLNSLKSLKESAATAAAKAEIAAVITEYLFAEGRTRAVANEVVIRKAELRSENRDDLQERLAALDECLKVIGY